MVLTQEITLDIYDPPYFAYVNAKQADNVSRVLVVTLTAHGEVLKPAAGTDTAVFRALKPDKTGVIDPAVIGQDGKITVALTDQALACVGRVEADISILKGDEVLSSATFYIQVDKAPVSGMQIESSNEFLIMAEAAAAANAAAEKANTAAGKADEATERANTAAGKANTAAKDAAEKAVEDTKDLLDGYVSDTGASKEAAEAAAKNAKNAETAAKASRDAAKGSEDKAKASQTASAGSASAASESAAAALASQNAAKSSADTAKTSETAAGQSAKAAADSVLAAGESAAAAEQSAKDAESAKTDAAQSERNAADSESNASASATAAAASAQSASASSEASKTAQTAAEAARDKAEAAQKGAETARDKAQTYSASAAGSAKSAEASAQKAVEYSGNPPKPQGGTWWVWDAVTGEYRDTNVKSVLSIDKSYPSIKAMREDFGNMPLNTLAIIASNVEEEDNSRLYLRGQTEWQFLGDLSGKQGITGPQGAAAGFGQVTATVDSGTGAPGVTVTSNGANTAKNFIFAFHNLKGADGADGADGRDGAQGVPGKDGVSPTITASKSGKVTTLTIKDASGTKTATINDGVNGKDGAVGPAGAQGPKGDTGAQGPQGVKGDTGAKGSAGARGSQWFSGTGVTGQSTTGTTFSSSGVSSALVGDYYLNTNTGYVYRCTTAGAASAAKWAYAGSIKGATGAKGATGDTGPTGPQGPQGVKGDTGAQGPTGPQGVKGDTGAKGSAGARGSQWFSGTGVTGQSTTGTTFSSSGVSSALVGDYYLNTNTGYVYRCTTAGAASAAKWAYAGSIKGATGAKGATGDTGPTGPQGPQGTKGATGAQGPQGPQGAIGQRGTGTLHVTTAPTAYTTVTGGFTPAYRISLSTVKSQSGVSAILVGDVLEHSYYHYPVGYVNASYVYTGERVSIRGATGAAGAAGATGPQGPQGTKGDTGAKGETGPNAVSTSTTSNITGLLKGSGGKVAQAVAGTDYVVPSGNITGNAATATKVGHNLTFTGGATGSWNGNAAKTVNIPAASTKVPNKSGDASCGSDNTWARADHVHPLQDYFAGEIDTMPYLSWASSKAEITAALNNIYDQTADGRMRAGGVTISSAGLSLGGGHWFLVVFRTSEAYGGAIAMSYTGTVKAITRLNGAWQNWRELG